MLRRTMMTMMFVLAAFVIGGAFVVPPGIAADDKTPDASSGKAPAKVVTPSHDAVTSKTVKGQIVNLHYFLANKQSPTYSNSAPDRPSAERVLGTLVPEVPIGLWVQDTSFVDKIVPGRPVYLIIFDPDQGTQKDAYLAARKLIGRMVSITGKFYEREGLKGLMIEDVKGVAVAETER